MFKKALAPEISLIHFKANPHIYIYIDLRRRTEINRAILLKPSAIRGIYASHKKLAATVLDESLLNSMFPAEK